MFRRGQYFTQGFMSLTIVKADGFLHAFRIRIQCDGLKRDISCVSDKWMILSIKMHIYLQRGKLKKSFNCLSKRKFHLANFTTIRKTKFFKLQKMVTNDEIW